MTSEAAKTEATRYDEWAEEEAIRLVNEVVASGGKEAMLTGYYTCMKERLIFSHACLINQQSIKDAKGALEDLAYTLEEALDFIISRNLARPFWNALTPQARSVVVGRKGGFPL